MKKIFGALLLAGVLGAAPARACDVCGYGPSNYNPFLFPHLAKSYVSLSYAQRGYRLLDHDGSWARAHSTSLVVSAQYRLSRRLQVLAQLPWQSNTLNSPEGSNSTRGIGDATLLLQVRALDVKKGPWRHTLLGGAGAKLPTGHFKADAEKTAGQALQPGSGSTDYLLNGGYRVGYRNWLLSTSASYKYNGTDRAGFRYGDVLTAGVQAVYRYEGKLVALAPYVQANHERQFNDADRHVLQPGTGGSALYVGGGVDASTRSVTVGLSYQWAAAQDLAGGAIRTLPRLQAHAAFSF